MSKIRPKKHLGQHFLKDRNIAQKIVRSLSGLSPGMPVVEIGPGMGVLTEYLVENIDNPIILVEVDKASVDYLNERYKLPYLKVVDADFLSLNMQVLVSSHHYSVIGNFPYNISSQIFFKVLEERHRVTEVVGMIQKEVAERIVSPPGNKQYGILSVLLSAFYDMEYLFTVPPQVFHPPPKVQSAVVRLKRNDVKALPCSEVLFFKVVKSGFQNRRKTLRNALKNLLLQSNLSEHVFLGKRAEQLSVNEFVELTNLLDNSERTGAS